MEEQVTQQLFDPRASQSSIVATPISSVVIATDSGQLVSFAVVEPSFVGFVTVIECIVVKVFADCTTFILASVFFGCKEL